jgi:hypothetical protein
MGLHGRLTGRIARSVGQNALSFWQIAMSPARDKYVTTPQTINRTQVEKTQYSWHELCYRTADRSRASLATRTRTGRIPQRIKSQERRLMMDLVFVLAIIGFFALCVGYAHAFDRI